MPRRIFKLVGGIAFLAVVLPIAYLFSGPYLDKRAVAKASEFCSSIAVGESLEALTEKASRAGVLLEPWPPRSGGEERYTAWFSGFLANAAYCDISVAKKRVDARFVELEFW
jgi:hypothetical protein